MQHVLTAQSSQSWHLKLPWCMNTSTGQDTLQGLQAPLAYAPCLEKHPEGLTRGSMLTLSMLRTKVSVLMPSFLQRCQLGLTVAVAMGVVCLG